MASSMSNAKMKEQPSRNSGSTTTTTTTASSGAGAISKPGPDPPKPLSCGGLPCARCNKCTDWKFTGDKATWNWIKEANQNDWPKKDSDRWFNDRIYKLFEKHGNCFFFGVDARDVDAFRRVVAFRRVRRRVHICLCD
ncbi:unnamed protein product [Rotaria socialis]